MRREIAQGIVYRNNGAIEFLIIKRVPEDGGFWQAVTAGIDEGETDVDALRRELLEEVGIESPLSISECLEYYEWGNPETGRSGRDHIFAVEVSNQTTINLDSREHSEFKWASLEEAMTLLKHQGNKNSMKLVAQFIK